METEALTAKRGVVELAIQRFAGGGEPLLLIHGIDAEMLYWHDELCNAFGESGFRVARFDSRDCGESSRLHQAGVPVARHVRREPGVAPYRLEDMADDAAAVLDELSWPTAHVVGHSMGGMVALLLAIRHPDRVLSLAAISSSVSGYVGRVRPMTILRLMRANPADFLGHGPKGPEEAADRLVRGHEVLGSPGHPPDEEWLRGIARIRHARGNDSGARARQEAAGWASGDLRHSLSGIHVPTVVLHGERDVFVRPEGGRAIADAVPGATFVEIAGMGHDLPRGVWPTLVQEIKTNAGLA